MENTAVQLGLETREREAVISHWADSIRAACDTLRRSSSWGMSCIVVTGRLDGPATERRLVQGVSNELAERYGFLVSVEVGDKGFTVRFRR
jgi:hypothetical protein